MHEACWHGLFALGAIGGFPAGHGDLVEVASAHAHGGIKVPSGREGKSPWSLKLDAASLLNVCLLDRHHLSLELR